MKEIVLATLILLASSNPGYCIAPVVQVKVMPAGLEIFTGQIIAATVEVTNINKVALQLPRPDRAAFSELLSIDNPQLRFSSGISIVSVTGESPTVRVEPGQSVSETVYLSGTVHGLSPVAFRIGFKTTAGAVPVWSNPVTIRFKKDKPFPVKVDAWLKEDRIDISNVQRPGQATAHVRIKNTSDAPQNIGIAGLCCLHELQSLISDNKAINIYSGITSCAKTNCSPAEVTLKPEETWEQDCVVTYQGEPPPAAPISFRIGVKSVGHVAAWSNPLTINILGGANHPDGITRTYYESGAIKDEMVYKDGKLNGPYKRYYPNGHLWQELHYVDNTAVGREKEYDETGHLTKISFYKQSQLVNYITYNKDGSIHAHVKFMKLEKGNYAPAISCAEDDSDREVLRAMPRCKVFSH
ncbi:MAG: hypothetical protein M0Z61_17040 [Nitrospiraceae bacterium]|nr:hypothetical protein [Nitrospiraceae bacterium]